MNDNDMNRQYENWKLMKPEPKRPALPKKVYGACASGAGAYFTPKTERKEANAYVRSTSKNNIKA